MKYKIIVKNEKRKEFNHEHARKLAYANFLSVFSFLNPRNRIRHNNAYENAIRPFALERKNWLFNKSPAGAESSCGIYSLIETAKQNNIEPLLYLCTLFEKAPFANSSEDWEKLLPWNIFNP